MPQNEASKRKHLHLPIPKWIHDTKSLYTWFFSLFTFCYISNKSRFLYLLGLYNLIMLMHPKRLFFIPFAERILSDCPTNTIFTCTRLPSWSTMNLMLQYFLFSPLKTSVGLLISFLLTFSVVKLTQSALLWYFV